MSEATFLPGVAVQHVLDRLAKAGGNEVGSGKFGSPESSSALAVNTFGWFIERPALLPALPGMMAGDPPVRVDVEYCARFPWSGGRHPWLDAVVETDRRLIGVELKRYEPFRGHKPASLSDSLRPQGLGREDGAVRGDARCVAGRPGVVPVPRRNRNWSKHAFGLVTEGTRTGKAPSLVYLHAEPSALGGKPISPVAHRQHRAEIARFSAAVRGAEVGFHAVSYRDWLATWPAPPNEVGVHARAVIERFGP